MILNFYYCEHCHCNVQLENLDMYEGIDGYMYHCSVCNSFLFTKPYKAGEPAEPEQHYALTEDEIRYTIHCLQKQENKLENALQQVHNTVTKLLILLETTKERNSNDR